MNVTLRAIAVTAALTAPATAALSASGAGRRSGGAGAAAGPLARRGESAERSISRMFAAYEAGRDGFWLAGWLQARGVETHVIHPTSVAVSREHR